MTTTASQRPTEAICPPWCAGHDGRYQAWETLTDGSGQTREHCGAEINVGQAHGYLRRTEAAGGTLGAVHLDLYADHDTAELTRAQVFELIWELIGSLGKMEQEQ